MKRSILSLVVLLASVSSFANTVTLPKDAVSVSPITEINSYQVVVPKPGKVPPGAQVEIMSVLQIVLPLNGCLDRLGPVTYTTENAGNGKLLVFLSATNIGTRGSASAKCFVAPTASVSIPLGFGIISKENVEIKLLTSSAN